MMKRIRLLLPVAGARRCALFLGVLAAAALASAPGVVHAAPQAAQGSDNDRARELFLRGKKDYSTGKMGEAYKSYRAAWELVKSYDIAGNLAVVELELAFYREAAEHASYALSHFPPGGAEAQRNALVDMVAKARREVGAITLRVNVEGAAVTVDGKPITETPPPAQIFVDPGSHVLVATAPGYDPVRDTVRTEKGSEHLVMLTLVKRASAGPGPGPVRPVVQGPRPIAVAGFVTAGVAAGLGTAMAILSAVKGSAADSKLADIGPSGCAGAAPSPACTDAHALLKSSSTLGNVAVWSFIGAGVVTAGTLVYTFVVPRHAASDKQGALRVLPAAGPGGGGVLVQGSF